MNRLQEQRQKSFGSTKCRNCTINIAWTRDKDGHHVFPLIEVYTGLVHNKKRCNMMAKSLFIM